MDILEFGMTAEKQQSATTSDFIEYVADDGGNYNPYNKAYFNNPLHKKICNDTGRITSIPSPYARMHITDLAFQEYNCGSGVLSKAKMAAIKMPNDYLRAMSHCLDLFELLFHADEFDLKEKGITIQKLNLVSTHSLDKEVQSIIKDDEGNLTNVGRYISTLDLFRDEYVKVIRGKGITNYHFDFSSLYIFKYKGKAFASTSPFTGFSAKSDCNLEQANLVVNGHKLLSKDPTSWLNLDNRDNEFKKFMYLLLKDTGLKDIFVNLFTSLNESLDSVQKTELNGVHFDNVGAFKKFNLGQSHLQKVKGQTLFIRPDGLDCSYLKYLLYLEDPVELTIYQTDYDTDLNERRFPSTRDGQLVPWFGVNDILADTLFILTYEINENYVVVPFSDKVLDDKEKRRCLLPIKRKALDFFTIDDLVSNIKIVHREESIYTVSLKVSLQNGGTIVLRREYHTNNPEFPNGAVVSGEAMKPFAFGIYPFVKSTVNQNIYKVLFYNSFEEDYSIKFYKRGIDGKVHSFLATECKRNRTNDISTNQEELPVNCEYHHLDAPEGLEFAELDVKGKGTSLIVPRLREVHDLPGNVNVAIDLGTSNTYVAYTYQPVGDADTMPEISEICTNHGSWNELTFMNRKCERTDDPNAPEKNREDLYLKTSDRIGAKPSDEWLDSQLCEFIPSRIDPNMGDESYCFPIPSVINFLRKNSKRENFNYNEDFVPLLHCAIPFAYYERGTRKGNYYDIIKDGSTFKWFYNKNDDGDFTTDKFGRACFKAFVSELLFIVRSHLVCKGFSLTQTHILWSYPLSFSPELVRDYVSIWNDAYRSIINPRVRREEIHDYVRYTNESRSPIFECLTNPSNVDHLTLLVDVGGGSTDIIGYQDRKPLFISSFGFAGNSLYLDGELNTVEQNAMSETILSYYVSKQDIFNQKSINDRTKKISMDDPISTIMNYGFTKDPDNFQRIFDNAGPKFMLLLHTSAIIYHMAQLCKIKSPREAPVEVFLTGNGSKLFEMIGYKGTIKKIFKYVYSSGNKNTSNVIDAIDDMKIKKPDNPKAATVRGALKGFCKNQLATNENSSEKQTIMLGDDKTTYIYKEEDGAAIVDFNGNYLDAVTQNVYNFVEMFYEIIFTTASPVLTKEEMIKAIDFVKGNSRLKINSNSKLSDSLFFQYIALVMEKISFDLRDRIKE